ncbi:integrator complex subunit 8-like [Apostichopus japonicus]|uniref:integrator complex subunit 8-like n=1 Tax=Stichopus japonicus TaxID=307972 RepID=UPI003AB1FA7B
MESSSDNIKPNNNSGEGKLIWFEFLLDNNLLKNHLAVENQDPSALVLLEQFVDQAIRSLGTEETPEQKWKTLSLNLMALKVAAYLTWDLTTFKQNLPLYMVHKVLKDFVEHVSPLNFSIQSVSSTICGLPDPILFALTTYNRWSIETYIESALPTKQPKHPVQQLPGSTFNVAGVNEMVLKTVQRYSTLKECVSFLEFVLNLDRDIFIPDFDYFPDGPAFDEQKMTGVLTAKLKKSELLCMVCFDLGLFYFHEKKHQKAGEMFQKSHALLIEVNGSTYCQNLDREALQGYLKSCSCLSPDGAPPSSDTLASRLVKHQKMNYQGVIDVLMEDNIKREIPFQQREFLLQEASSSGLLNPIELLQICLCNALRQVSDNQPVSLSVWNCLQSIPVKHYEGSGNFLQKLVFQLPVSDKPKISSFLWSLKADRNYRQMITPPVLKFLLQKDADSSTLSEDMDDSLPLIQHQPATVGSHDNVGVYLGQLTLGLILSHDPAELDDLLTRLHKVTPSGRYASAYSKWHIDKSYAFIIDGLGNKKRQDMITLLLVKAQHCLELKNFTSAKRLLQAAHNLMKECSSKLQRALVNEMLYVDLLHAQDSGYKYLGGKMEETVKRIQACSACVQNDREIRPREAILRLCSLYIMNMQQWQLLRTMGDHDPIFKICSSLVEVVQNLPNVAHCRQGASELWDHLTKILSFSNTTKRDFLGVPVKRNTHNEVSSVKRMEVLNFILQLKSRIVLSILLSCLTRFHNIVKEDPANCLSLEHTGIWPRLVSSTQDLSASTISSVLSKTLNHSLQVHPDQTFWLKTKADMELSNSQPVAALRYYLLSIAASTRYFQRPVTKETVSAEILLKMIKCCSALKCFTQVAVLCQFLESVDHSTAFKALQEKMCYDGGDALYQFFWDLTILEYLVYMHNKRNEEEKKQVALRALNHPELNSCNPSQILQAAAQRRKSKFLLALARQYL